MGWNINPGAINRSTNGSPDDYNSALMTKFFYSNEEAIENYSANLGYSWGTGSVGLGFSWGSHKSLGGHVSIGLGANIGGEFGIGMNLTVGTNGMGIGANIRTPSGLGYGITANSESGLAANFGVSSENGTGFNISTSGNYGFSIASGSKSSGNISSLGINFSSSGTSISISSYKYKYDSSKMTYNKVGGMGTSINLAFENTINMGDFTTSHNSFVMPIIVPTPIGIFNFSFGKSEFLFKLNKRENNYLIGANYFYKNNIDGLKWEVRWPDRSSGRRYAYKTKTFSTESEADIFINQQVNSGANRDDYSKKVIYNKNLVQDIYELPIRSGDFMNSEDFIFSNPNFPNYDKFNVQAQGLSGSISGKVFENGALYGFSNKEDSKGNKLNYVVNALERIPETLKFTKKPQFYFDNEISTYLEVAEKELNANILNRVGVRTSNPRINRTRNLLSKFKSENIVQRKTANHIEYYSNQEIIENLDVIKSNGFLTPSASGFDRRSYPKSGIGGFKITSIDGKTYHYSLPVYNYEIIQRTYGTMKFHNTNKVKKESEAYFQKSMLEPYATHWLLTAITGPDFIDMNNDGMPNKGDYGYWVNFDYGKYSEAFVWANPYDKEVLENKEDDNIKTWIRGRKEIYYLDKIQTRTHTALFVKSERQDAKSKRFAYRYAKYKRLGATLSRNGRYEYTTTPNFIIPSQKPMKLDKIILIREENDFVSKESGNEPHSQVGISYTRDLSRNVPFNIKNNIIDSEDNLDFKSTIIKSITFDSDYSLAKGTPNSDSGGRLTLKKVYFNGKYDISRLPPYEFNYINPNYKFNLEDKDNFGYVKNQNEIWSLKKITTPEGGKINVNYEGHSAKSALNSEFTFFKKGDENFDLSKINERTFKLTSTKELGIKLGDKFMLFYEEICVVVESDGDRDRDKCKSEIEGTITQILSKGEFILTLNETVCDENEDCNGGVRNYTYRDYYATYLQSNTIKNIGGIRVKNISTVNQQNNSHTMNYSYGKENDGVGYITYLPFAPELAKEIPYSAELPPPKLMYEYVSTTTSDSNQSSYGIKTDYRFNVIKNKTEGKAKFENFYELTSKNIYGNNNSETQLRSFTIKDNLAAIGQLLSVCTYNKEGQLLSEIQNSYYKPGETPNKLGVIQESYQTYKSIEDKGQNIKKLGVASTRITYPNLLKSSTEYKGGFSYTSEFNDLNEITGQAQETYSYSSDGIRIKDRGVLAYKKYPNMGSKVDNINNKNMLSQQAANYTYLIDPVTNEEKLIGAGITTWNNQWDYRNPLDGTVLLSSNTPNNQKVWRKHKTYVWDGELNEDGTYKNFVGEDDGFVWGVGQPQTNSRWKNTATTTMYDHFSMPLETQDINGNYTSTKMGDNQTKVIAVSNAKYTEMYYSGAEYSTKNLDYFD